AGASDVRLLRRRLAEPPVGDDAAAAGHAAFEDELADPGVIPEGDGEAAAADFLAIGVDLPISVGLHAVGAPDLFGQVGGERLAGGAADENADQIGLAGLVDPFRARG